MTSESIMIPRPDLRIYHEDQACWRVDGRPYYNKIAALRAASPNHPVSFHLFDESFGGLDWAEEDGESWESLLHLRAAQLRDCYGYIRLWYSGGSDSHTMLSAFLDNNIHLDEIAMYRCSPINDYSGPGNSEINEVALPFLKSMASRLPNTKITLLDIGREQYERVYLSDEWLEFANIFRFRPYNRKYAYLFFPELLDPVAMGQSHCNVAGWEKPWLSRRNGKFYAYFWDRQICGDIGSPFMEFFYLSPEFPRLHRKQCHMLKNWVQENCQFAKENGTFAMTATQLQGYRKAARSPLWKAWSMPKGKDDFLCSKAVATLEEGKRGGARTYFAYRETLRKLRQEHPAWFDPSQDFAHRDLWKIKSAEYCLGE